MMTACYPVRYWSRPLNSTRRQVHFLKPLTDVQHRHVAPYSDMLHTTLTWDMAISQRQFSRYPQNQSLSILMEIGKIAYQYMDNPYMHMGENMRYFKEISN